MKKESLQVSLPLKPSRRRGRNGTRLGCPIRVWSREQAIVGWAALSAVSRRACYAGVAEVGIYVARAARGRGVGLALLRALIESAEAHEIWTLQGATIAENLASLALQAKCGFRVVGRRQRIGKLNEAWRDTILTERRSSKVGTD